MIVTEYIYPPIPDRRWDWMAHVDGDEELTGYGSTETEALRDLCEQLVMRQDELQSKAYAEGRKDEREEIAA